MTSLSQTALEFAHEVMDWHDAKITNGREWIGYNWQIDPINPAESGCALFDYTELNAVMAAAQQWCDTKGTKQCPLTFSLTYNWHAVYLGEVCDWDEPLYERTLSTSPCQALLAACVEASRKLKAAG